MALLNLVHRDQLFPRPVHARVFEALLAGRGEKQACRCMVGLLALAHERTCEAERADLLAEDLDAGRLPDLKAVQVHFAPAAGSLPAVSVALASLGAYDDITACGQEAGA